MLGPPPTSGTRDAFNELVIEGGCNTYPELKALKDKDEAKYKSICLAVREDGAYIEAGENDNLIVQKLVANPNALGVFGFSFLDQNTDRIQGSIVGGVEPTFENIASGKYPVSRPLFIYVKNAHVKSIPGIREYVEEFTSEKAIGDEGYLTERGLIPAPKAEREKYRDRRQEPHRIEDDGGQIAPSAGGCHRPAAPRRRRGAPLSVFVLLAAIAALAAGGFVLARGRALAAADGGARLHSLPGYYGWYGALWSALPGIAVTAAVARRRAVAAAVARAALRARRRPRIPRSASCSGTTSRTSRAGTSRRRARTTPVRSTAAALCRAARARAHGRARAHDAARARGRRRSRCAGSGPRSRRAFTSSASCAASCCFPRRSRSS